MAGNSAVSAMQKWFLGNGPTLHLTLNGRRKWNFLVLAPGITVYKYVIEQGVIGRLAGKKLFRDLVGKLGERN